MRRSRVGAVRQWAGVVLLCSGLAVGLPGNGAAAEDEVVPGSCKLHPNKILNPGCVPTLAGPVTEPGHTYPNLVPNVTETYLAGEWTYDPATNTFTEGPPLLWFDTWAQNLGTVPVDLAADDPTNAETSTVSQCVSWMPDYVCRERQQAGGFTWHDEHTHFHFNDFAAYQLRRVNPDGGVDYSATGLLATSDKVSFCLIDSRRVDPSSLSVPTYHLCGNARQGITPGWTDIYGSSLPGQQFPITGLDDGRYAIVVDMNTAGNVLESDTTDNRVEVIIDIAVGAKTATIVETRWP